MKNLRFPGNGLQYNPVEKNRSGKTMKRNKAERGQAIAEFVTCLIGMVFIFLGLLVVSILSMENVRCVLDTRSEVDTASGYGTTVGGKDPEPIVEWDWGKDNIPFTADDTSVTGTLTTFGDEFDTSKNTLADATVSASTPTNPNDRLYILPLTLNKLGEHGYADTYLALVNFLDAAELNGATKTVRDPLTKHGLPDLEKLIRSFSGNTTFTLQDSVYMPARVD